MRDIIFKMGIEGITICYGLTEGSPVLTQTKMEDSLEQRITTVGKPLPGIEVAIFSQEDNKILGLGETGEICCRGYNVMAGYYNMEDETSMAIDDDGWLHTGDLGSLDENGCLRLTGRIKDMIIRGGENIYPREIEDFIRELDGIEDVQIVGVPSQKYGEEVGAFLVLNEGKLVTLEHVRNFCKGRIAWYKIPKYLQVLASFPKTSSGKIQKYKLKELARDIFAPDSKKMGM